MKKWNGYWNGARVKSSEISFISCEFSNCYPICNLNFTVECLNCIFVSFSSCCISVCVACPLAPASPRYSSLIESKVFPLTHSPTPLPLPVRCKTKRQTDSGKVENFYTLCRLFRLFRRRSFWCVSCINKRARCYCYFYCFAAVVGWLIIAPTASTCLAVSCLTLRQFSSCQVDLIPKKKAKK